MYIYLFLSISDTNYATIRMTKVKGLGSKDSVKHATLCFALDIQRRTRFQDNVLCSSACEIWKTSATWNSKRHNRGRTR